MILPVLLATGVVGLVYASRSKAGMKLPVLPSDADPEPPIAGPGRAINLFFIPLGGEGRMVRVEPVLIPGYEKDAQEELPGVPLSTVLRPFNAPLGWLSTDQTHGYVYLTEAHFPWEAGEKLRVRRKGV